MCHFCMMANTPSQIHRPYIVIRNTRRVSGLTFAFLGASLGVLGRGGINQLFFEVARIGTIGRKLIIQREFDQSAAVIENQGR